MLWKIYVAGVVAMLLILLFVVPFPKATSRKETSANLLTSASVVVFWPLFLFWLVYDVISIWLQEIDESETDI